MSPDPKQKIKSFKVADTPADDQIQLEVPLEEEPMPEQNSFKKKSPKQKMHFAIKSVDMNR